VGSYCTGSHDEFAFQFIVGLSEQRQKRRDRQSAQKESNVAIQEKAGIRMGAQY
jgi:uncharacterized membrane protein